MDKDGNLIEKEKKLSDLFKRRKKWKYYLRTVSESH